MVPKEEADVKRNLIRLDKVDISFKQDTDIFALFLAEELELYKKKRRDYGPYPINETGVVGLMVRIHDKVHRVMNLSEDGKNIEVSDERLEDTLKDIANYANMGLLQLEHKRMQKWRID